MAAFPKVIFGSGRVVLQQRREEAHQTFKKAGVPRAAVPFIKGQLTALAEVVQEYSFVHTGGLLVVDVGRS